MNTVILVNQNILVLLLKCVNTHDNNTRMANSAPQRHCSRLLGRGNHRRLETVNATLRAPHPRGSMAGCRRRSACRRPSRASREAIFAVSAVFSWNVRGM